MVLALTVLLFVLYGIGVVTAGLGAYGLGIFLGGHIQVLLGKAIGFWLVITVVPALGAIVLLDDFVSWNHIYPVVAAAAVGVFAGLLYGRLAKRQG